MAALAATAEGLCPPSVDLQRWYTLKVDPERCPCQPPKRRSEGLVLECLLNLCSVQADVLRTQADAAENAGRDLIEQLRLLSARDAEMQAQVSSECWHAVSMPGCYQSRLLHASLACHVQVRRRFCALCGSSVGLRRLLCESGIRTRKQLHGSPGCCRLTCKPLADSAAGVAHTGFKS